MIVQYKYIYIYNLRLRISDPNCGPGWRCEVWGLNIWEFEVWSLGLETRGLGPLRVFGLGFRAVEGLGV